MYNLVVICHHTLYLPFVYITFLSDFFQVYISISLRCFCNNECHFSGEVIEFLCLQEEDLLLDNAYYSEMKDAGFFDDELE